MSTEASIAARKDRPVGVWILTIYAAIFLGFVPGITSLLILFGLIPSFDVSPLSQLITIPLSAALIITAVGTWKGSDRSRKAFLALVAVYYLLLVLTNGLLLFSEDMPTRMTMLILGRTLRSVLYTVIYFWYFNKYSTLTFFG